MTDAIEKRYEEAKRYLRDQLGYVFMELLDGLGFRALLEIEEAAQELCDLLSRGSVWNGEVENRLRAALAARAEQEKE